MMRWRAGLAEQGQEVSPSGIGDDGGDDEMRWATQDNEDCGRLVASQSNGCYRRCAMMSLDMSSAAL
ncbi:hypothetical protein NL676_010874 [Syzygium grande]|nr:hypothetical protein NL676_010874 [Syzygium grande]